MCVSAHADTHTRTEKKDRRIRLVGRRVAWRKDPRPHCVSRPTPTCRSRLFIQYTSPLARSLFRTNRRGDRASGEQYIGLGG